MMRMSEHEGTENCEQEVRLWLEKKGIPYERYMNLSAFNKIVLRNQVCKPTRPTTHAQRRELYKKLFLPDRIIAGRKSIDPLDFVPDEELKKVFSPLTPGEKLPYLYKF